MKNPGLPGPVALRHSIPISVVLIVEDAPELAQLIEAIVISEPGYRAVAVPDAPGALNVISQLKVSLILLDVQLPGMSGLELYDKLQAEHSDRAIPVLFLTAGYYQAEFKRRGIKDFLPKPFSIDQLIARVDHICRPN